MKALCCSRDHRSLGMKGKCSRAEVTHHLQFVLLGYPALPSPAQLCWSLPCPLLTHRPCPGLLAATSKSQKPRQFSICLKMNKFKARSATGTFTFQTHFSKYEIPNTFRALGFLYGKGESDFNDNWRKPDYRKYTIYPPDNREILCTELNCTAKIKEWTRGSSV